MTVSEYEFVNLPELPVAYKAVIILSDKTGFAIADKFKLVHFLYDYNDRQNVPIEEIKSYLFNDEVKTYILVEEINLALVFAGSEIFSINLTNHIITQEFDNVTALCAHHPGFEPVIVPISDEQQTNDKFDLSCIPMHLTPEGLDSALFDKLTPRSTVGRGLFDFLIVMDGLAFVIYAYSAEGCKNPCVSAEPGNYTVSYLSKESASGYNPANVQFENFLNLSNLAFFTLENGKKQKISIQKPLWVGDFIFYYIEKKYYALDLKKLSLVNAAKQIEQEAPIFDITGYSVPLIECQNTEELNIALIGPEMCNKQLISSTVNELTNRIKQGISIDLKDKTRRNDGNLYYMDEIAKMQITKLRTENEAINDVVANKEFFTCLSEIKPVRPVVREGERFVKVETLYKEVQNLLNYQSQCQEPYVIVARPVEIGFELDECYYGLYASDFSASEMTNGKSCGYEQICNSQYRVCDNVETNIIFPRNIEEIIKLPIDIDSAAENVYNYVVNGYNSEISIFALRTDEGIFKLEIIKETRKLFDELSSFLNHQLVLDSVYINQKKETLIKMQTNNLDKTELLIILGMMHYALKNYEEAVNYFLEAPLVNPLAIIKLFFTNLNIEAVATQEHKYRKDAPSFSYVEKCENFGLFKRLLEETLSDESWKYLSDAFNRNDEDEYYETTLVEWRGKSLSEEELNYAEFKNYNSDLIQLIWPWLSEIPNEEQLLDIPENEYVTLYKLNELPNVKLDTFKQAAEERIIWLAYYLRVYCDNKLNFKEYLVQAFKHAPKSLNKELAQRIIAGNEEIYEEVKSYPRNGDSSQIFMRTIFAILLSASPFNVAEGFLFNCFFTKPEDEEVFNFHEVYSMLVSTNKNDIENAIGLLALTRRYKDAGELASFCKTAIFTVTDDINQFKYTTCLLFSFCNTDGATLISEELDILEIDDYSEKAIYWNFVPHVCKYDITSAVMLLSKKYKFLKKNELNVQEIIFDKINIKFSSELKNYMKPPKDETINDICESFTSQFLIEFLVKLRFTDLEEIEDKNSEEYEKEYVKERAYVMVFLFIVSKCVSISFNMYNNNNYNIISPNWQSQIETDWLSPSTAEFLNSFLPLYNDEDDATQMSFFTSVAKHLEPVIISLEESLNNLTLEPAAEEQEKSSEISGILEFKARSKKFSLEEKSTEQIEIQNLLAELLAPYELCLVKSGNVDEAVELQFVNLFREPNFYEYFDKIVEMKQQKLISDIFSVPKEQYSNYVQKINPDHFVFSLDDEVFERVLESFTDFSKPIIQAICRENFMNLNEVEVIIDEDNEAYCQETLLKAAACRSEVILLHELVKCCNLALEAELISINTYLLIIRRLTLKGSLTAKIIAKYAPQRFFRLLYKEMNCYDIMQFLRDSFNENAEKQRDICLEEACIQEALENSEKDLCRCQQGAYLLTARNTCEKCGKLLLKTNFGNFRSCEGQAGFILTHADCK